MFVRAQIPKSRTSLTPQNFKPICIGGDNTPTRSNNVSYCEPSVLVQNTSFLNNDRQNYPLPQKIINRNYNQHPDKENLVRVQGTSFGGNKQNQNELQIQLQNLQKNTQEMCQKLSEVIQRNTILQNQIDQIKIEKETSAQQYQNNVDQYFQEFNELNYKIYQLEEQNHKLSEQSDHQQWYLQQIECQSSRYT